MPWNPEANDLFLKAVEMPSPEQRRIFLQEACCGRAELRAQVEALLAAGEQAGSFLDAPARALAGLVDTPMSEHPGTVIGPYKLLEQIGDGGFGVVFMAEQTQPMRRKVALKILKPGMDTRQVVARFEAERQALALMDHPNIAHVFDGGETASGRPYFVMELVRGIPITDFCDQNHLPISERLELFVKVCLAVQHAHQKGIIHRDLKPSNIMVTLHDGTPVAKVIDFGIAKALGQQLTDKTLFTNFAQMIGTPVYMSPEQAEMSGLDMDTRSDIYSLGVLLYELLTGTTPCDQERLKTAAFDEIRRMIREEEPATPSRKITTLGAAATAVSTNRKSDPRRLSQLVRGDLDWIVMKALEKDRNRRYETSGALAGDVLRYLNDEPVLACPPSAMYRLRRIVRRHKGPVLAATLVMLALVAGMIGTTWGMLQANDAQATAVQETGHKEEALKAKVAALADAKDKLQLALVSQARAARGSGRVGRRFEALKAIRQAAQIRMTPELRDEAIAALVLPDAEIACEWEGWPEGTVGLSFDSAFQRYARIDKQGRITVCRLSDGREEVVFRLRAHGKPAFGHPGLSPDGRFLVYGHGGTEASSFPRVRVWKLDGPEPVVLPLDETSGMSEFAATFHASSPRLAIGHRDKTISVYDLNTGRRVQQLMVSAVPSHLAFHPRDTRLAAACGNAVQILDTDTGRELARLRHPTGMRTSSVAWHPDGRRLATGSYDRTIRIWDTQSATEVMPPWVGHTLEGIRLTFNRAGDRLVSHDWGIQTRLWDVATGRMLLTLPDVFGGQFSPDDSLFGFGRNGSKLQLYRVAGGRELRVLRRRHADSLERISYPVVHADGLTVAASGDNWLSFFNLASGDELGSVRLPYKYAADPVFFDFPSQSDGKVDNGSRGWMTGGYGGMFRWPARSDQLRPEVLRVGPAEQLAPGLLSAYARGSSASKDGQVVAVPQGNSTVVLHRNHPERRKVLGPQYDVRFTAVSPDGRWVVTSSHWPDGRSKSAWIWDAGSGKKVHELPLEGSTAAAFSPDGRWLMTRSTSVGCRLWEVGTWRLVKHIATDRGSFAFSPDSRLLAVNDVFSVIRLLETATGREVARLTGPEPLWYPPACFSPDGTRLIATCSDTTALFVWDLRLIRQQLKELEMDWHWPEFQPSDAVANSGPSRVEVQLGDLVKFIQTPEQKAQQTIERYRADVKGNPKDARACNGLAWAYLTAPETLRDVKAAVPLAEKAVSLAPENAIYRNTLGLAYYRVDRCREAVDTLRPKLASQEDWCLAFDLYFLAMSYQRLGETERAKDYYDWAVRWTGTQTKMSPAHLEELQSFRAEAERVMNEKEKRKD